MKKVALIPIDNRPVCYQLPKFIASIDSDIDLVLPPRKFLGGLTSSSDINAILNWLINLEHVDKLIVSLDTIAYGGLVNSRRCSESYDEILSRVNTFFDIIVKKNIKVYAFSSVMRISNNNINEEEKFYWNKWGKRIFDYSYNLHLSQVTKEKEALSKSECIEKSIPDEILFDYLSTRKRNYHINLYYLEKQKQGLFKELLFSMDDCAKYGFNVKEASCIKLKGGIVKTGADEIPLTLLSSAISENLPKLKFYITYSCPKSFHKISRYEDISVRECCFQQIKTAGGEVVFTQEEADVILHVNNFDTEQGDLMLADPIETNINKISYIKPFLVADIANANGSDNNFIEKNIDIFNSLLFLGYAGWNTTGNTLGSVISAAIIKYHANLYNEKAFKRLQLIRLIDDWAYQANIRKKIKEEIKSLDTNFLKKEMEPYVRRVKNLLNIKNEIDFKYPWSRFFEIEVLLK